MLYREAACLPAATTLRALSAHWTFEPGGGGGEDIRTSGFSPTKTYTNWAATSAKVNARTSAS